MAWKPALWNLPRRHRSNLSPQAEEQKPGEVKIPGGKIVQNKVADRLQIFFDEKPPEAMCTNLKRNAELWLLAGGS